MYRMSNVGYFHYLLNTFEFNKWNSRDLHKLKKALEEDSSYIDGKGEECGFTPLSRMLLAKYFSIDIIRLLLDFDADPNSRDDDEEIGGTPLIVALLMRRDDAVIRLLLEKGAGVEARDRFGCTTLCYALMKGASIDVLNLLLEGGCHPNACGYHNSPMACVSNDPTEDDGLKEGVLDLLIGAGADVLKIGIAGEAPICRALRAVAGVKDIQRLLRLGASLKACQRHNSPLLCATDFKEEADEVWQDDGKIWGMPLKADVVEMLLKAGAPADSVNDEGHTALQSALYCCNYQIKAIELLLDLPGLDFSVKDFSNRNLLHLAVGNFYCKQSAVKSLIKRGVKLDELNRMGQTPLRAAIQRCTLSVANLLLKYGSPVNAGDIEGNTPLSTAVRCKRGFDIIQLLLFAGARIGVTNNPGDDSLVLTAFDHFCSDKRKNTLDVLILLLKYCFLENPKFEMELLIWRHRNVGSRFVKETMSFANKCAHEIQVMKSNNIGNNRSLFSYVVNRRCFPTHNAARNSPSLRSKDFNRLLSILIDNDFPQYFELIASTVGKYTMETKLQELQVYAIKNDKILNCVNEKIYLNYDCVCEIIPFLTAADLLRLILAYAQRNRVGHSHHTRYNKRRTKSHEQLVKFFGKHQKLN